MCSVTRMCSLTVECVLLGSIASDDHVFSVVVGGRLQLCSVPVECVLLL